MSVESVYIVTIRNEGDERVLARNEVESLLLDAATKYADADALPVTIEVEAT